MISQLQLKPYSVIAHLQHPIRESLVRLLSWVPPNPPSPLLDLETGRILFTIMVRIVRQRVVVEFVSGTCFVWLLNCFWDTFCLASKPCSTDSHSQNLHPSFCVEMMYLMGINSQSKAKAISIDQYFYAMFTSQMEKRAELIQQCDQILSRSVSKDRAIAEFLICTVLAENLSNVSREIERKGRFGEIDLMDIALEAEEEDTYVG